MKKPLSCMDEDSVYPSTGNLSQNLSNSNNWLFPISGCGLAGVVFGGWDKRRTISPTVTLALSFSNSTTLTPDRLRYNSSRACIRFLVSCERHVRFLGLWDAQNRYPDRYCESRLPRARIKPRRPCCFRRSFSFAFWFGAISQAECRLTNSRGLNFGLNRFSGQK